MKHKLLASLVAILCSVLPSVADVGEYNVLNPEVVGAKTIGIEQFQNLVIVYRIQSGADNIIEAYRFAYENQDLVLDPVGAFREESVREYHPLASPISARIVDALGDSPTMIQGSVTYRLQPGTAQKIHHDNKMLLVAYADYQENPEAYPELQGKQIFPAHTGELLDAYKSHASQTRMTVRQQKLRAKEAANNTFKWFEIALLLPVVLLLWLKNRTSGAKMATGFHSNIRCIALAEVLAAVMIIAAMYAFVGSNWPWIVLSVVLILTILVTALFSSMDVYEHIKFACGGKFPWFSALAFGWVGMLSMVQIVATPLLLASQDLLGIEVQMPPTSSLLLGWAMVAAFLFVVGYWYYKSLTQRAPQLGRSFVWIAIATIVAMAVVLTLFVVIIAFVIFKGTGKSFLKSGEAAARGNGVGHDCSRCRHRDWTGKCTIYGTWDTPAFNCPNYTP